MAKINFTKIAKEVIETEIQSLKKLKKNIKSSFNKAVQAILNCKKGKVIISGVAFSDQDIINFISNLNNKDLVEQASLQAMNVPKGEGDLQSANNKKGFSILCKLKI